MATMPRFFCVTASHSEFRTNWGILVELFDQGFGEIVEEHSAFATIW